ncbi:hypothetical protein [Nocardia neocaledoniensis]|uniref:hypothetical protein n=1 Tax=Nocardia neocaledoniensis TaxID=236511 RepID=UPI0024579257|nr:hypothetical protein [Nocardia neocaledoniensis]
MTTDEILTLEWRTALEGYRDAKGKAVRYLAPDGRSVEYGRIVRVDHKYVHVLYEHDDKPTPTCPVNLAPVDRVLRGNARARLNWNAS